MLADGAVAFLSRFEYALRNAFQGVTGLWLMGNHALLTAYAYRWSH